MEELLMALQKQDHDEVRRLADQLFFTKDNRVNWAQISEFAAYAPCRMYPTRASCVIWLWGAIYYGAQVYYFGEFNKKGVSHA